MKPSTVGSSLTIAVTAIALSACGPFGGGGGSGTSSGSSGSGGGGSATSGGGTLSGGGSGSGGGGSATSGGGTACQPARLMGARFTAMSDWQMAAIDPVTGMITALGPIASASSFQQGGSTYDPATKRVYLLGAIADQPAVVTIDGATGATLNAVMLQDVYAMNPEVVGAGIIVVLHQTSGGWETATLDPSTGDIASLSIISEGGFSADRAFDASTNRLFTINNTNGAGGLVTLDGTTGAQVVKTPMADVQFTNAVVNGAGDLRGLHQTGGSWFNADLNPSTGVITDLAPVAVTSVYGGLSAFDPCADRIYHLTPDGVLTVDGSSGAVLSLVPLPAGQANFATIEAVW